MTPIPSYQTIDHFGITVPDLDVAIEFFENVLGAELWYQEGPYEDAEGDSMWAEMRIDRRAVERLAMLKLNSGTTIELLEFLVPGDDGGTPPPVSKNSAAHLALRVGDIDAAAEYLREAPGVEVLQGPQTVEDGISEGLRWIYFLTPWGLAMELIQFPPGMTV